MSDSAEYEAEGRWRGYQKMPTQDADLEASRSGFVSVPDAVPEANDDCADDPFLTELMESMSRPLCPECLKIRWDRLPSPLWHCPHRQEAP